MITRRTITSREEWLQWRKPNVNASRIGALFDCHPYETALKLYAEQRGTEFIVEDTKAMRRGRWMEPSVAKAVEETRPEWKLEPGTEYLCDPDLKIGATPDFKVYDRNGDRNRTILQRDRFGILQAKTVAPSVYDRDWKGGVEVPKWIILQAVTEAMLEDADFIVIAALLVDAHNMDVSIHELPRNPAAEEKIKAKVAEFWRCVEEGREPEPDFERDADVLKAMWRKESEPPNEIDLSGDNVIRLLLEERAALQSAEKMAHDRIASINNQIIYALKDAAIATLPGWKITYKTQHSKEYTVAARDARVLRVSDQREKTNQP